MTISYAYMGLSINEPSFPVFILLHLSKGVLPKFGVVQCHPEVLLVFSSLQALLISRSLHAFLITALSSTAQALLVIALLRLGSVHFQRCSSIPALVQRKIHVALPTV